MTTTHTADSDARRKWDSQYPSLWITDGGGGTFADTRTSSTFAQAGVSISNTSTSGRIYELSSEHHVRNEVKLNHVSNCRSTLFRLKRSAEKVHLRCRFHR